MREFGAQVVWVSWVMFFLVTEQERTKEVGIGGGAEAAVFRFCFRNPALYPDSEPPSPYVPLPGLDESWAVIEISEYSFPV